MLWEDELGWNWDAEVLQRLGGDSLSLAHEPQEEVFGADVPVSEAARLVARQEQRLLHPLGGSIVHETSIDQAAPVVGVDRHVQHSIEPTGRRSLSCQRDGEVRETRTV